MIKGNFRISRKAYRILLTVTVILLVTALPVFAWYTMSARYSRTEDMPIDMPPIIYVKDDNLQEITTFNLDGLKIGEAYNTVFCVSPTILGSVETFFLGVIYTENLGMNISLYPVFSVTDTAPAPGALYEERNITSAGGAETTKCYFNYNTEVTADPNDITYYTYKETYGNWENTVKPDAGHPNVGVYKAYSNMKFGDVITEPSELIDKMNDTGRFRFFVLNITWEDDTATENVKETDIVYIVTNGIRA